MSSEEDSYSYHEGDAFYGRNTGELIFKPQKSRSNSNSIENFSDYLGKLEEEEESSPKQSKSPEKRLNLAEIRFKSPRFRKIRTRQFQVDYSPPDAPITDYKIKEPTKTDSKMK